MTITKITCDGCGADISSTEATPQYRLRLSAEMLPFTMDYRHAVHVSPMIKEDHHFCSIVCVANWSTRKARV